MTHIAQMAELIPDSLYFERDSVLITRKDQSRFVSDLRNPSGEGSSSIVYKAKRKNTDSAKSEREDVAVKCLRYLTTNNIEERAKRRRVSVPVLRVFTLHDTKLVRSANVSRGDHLLHS
jgi:hypothetical protein